MLFKYQATTPEGKNTVGTVDAVTKDLAIGALQRRGLIVLSVVSTEKKSLLELTIFERVSAKDIVILSRQLSTLFEAKVPVMDSFRLLANESEKPILRRSLGEIADDIQSGLSISKAAEKHPQVFSNFYVNMIASAEESGKMSETLKYLADYLERQHELTSKAKHAMVYPSFVILAFVAVMVLMFVVVIPKLSEIIEETGQEIPIYTKVVIATSHFFVDYGIFLLMFVVLGALGIWRYSLTEKGKMKLEYMKLSVPYVGDLYNKLYLSRIADNLDTMLTSGISMIKAIEVTSRVVGSDFYKKILESAAEDVRGGRSLSMALSKYPEIPRIMTQMVKIGEQTGKLGYVLGTVAKFYRQEVQTAIETIVSLIEPVMIILLGVGVGVLLTSVLMPIYNIAGSI